jgi:hypothetical protein
MSGRQAWSAWSHEHAKKTGRCIGNVPSFGLPSDQVTESEFVQSTKDLRAHDVRTCRCWGAPIMNPQAAPATPPRVSDGVVVQTIDAQVGQTEQVVRGRVLQAKILLKDMIDKIAVSDFRSENGVVVWEHFLPPALFSTVKNLPKFLTPQSRHDQLPQEVVEGHAPPPPRARPART